MNTPQYDRQAVFNYIVGYKRRNDGISPTMREIKEEFKIASISTVSLILDELEAAHRIRRSGNGKVGIRVVGGKWIYEGVDNAL